MKRFFLILSLTCLVALFAASQSAQSDSLFAKGVEFYNAAKYKEAIPFFEECNQLDKAQLDSTSNRRGYASMWLASCYYNLHNDDKAKEFDNHYREIPIDRRKTVESDSLFALATKFYNEKEFKQSLSCLLKCAQIEENAAGKGTWFLSNTLYFIGVIYSNLNQNEKAVDYFKQVVTIYEDRGYDNNADFSVLLNQLALSYNSLQEYENAIKIIEKAVPVAKTGYGDASYNYALILSNAGLCYKSAKNYVTAISYYKQAAEILGLLDKSDISYINARKRVAECMLLNGQYEDASVIFKQLLPVYKERFGKESGEYLFVLEELHTATKKMGKFEDAIELCDESITLRIKLFGNAKIGLAQQYREQAENYAALKLFREAITCASKSMEIFKVAKGEQDEYYASALAYLGYCYSYDKQYEKAIEIVKQAILIRRATIGEDDPNFITSVLNLGTYYKEIFQYEKAIECAKFVVEKREKIYGKTHVEYARALSWLAEFNNCQGKYDSAILLEKEACLILSNNIDTEYLICLGSLASYYSNNGNYDKAIEIGIQSLNICKEIFGKNNKNYIIILEGLGSSYCNLGDYRKAIQLSEIALEIGENLYGRESVECSSILNRISDYYQRSGMYQTALDFANEAFTMRKKYKINLPVEFAYSLGTLSIIYSQLGLYNKAQEYALMQQQELQNVLGKNHPIYMRSLENYGSILMNTGEFEQALKIENDALEICNHVLGNNNIAYYEILEKKANIYGLMGSENDAIAIYQIISEYCKNNLSSSHPLSLRNQRNMAQELLSKGLFTEARKILVEIGPIIVETHGKLHPTYSSYLGSLSDFYMEIGNPSYAITLLQERLLIEKELYGEYHDLYANCLNNLAKCYFSMSDYKNAIECSEKAKLIIDDLFGKDDFRYAITLSNLCAYYNISGISIDRSIKYGEMALNILKKTIGEDNQYYATALVNLSMSYSKAEKPEKSISLTNKALDVRQKILGDKNQACIFLYQVLSSYYALVNDTLNVSQCENEFIARISEHILISFTSLTANERKSYWNQYLPYFNLSCIASYKFPTKELNRTAYNGILLSKGLLLNADIEIKKLIRESDDTSVTELYKQVRANQHLLQMQCNVPISSRLIDIDSLASVIYSQNIELMNKSKVLGDFTKRIKVKWEDVKNALSEEEIAVEFEKFSLNDSVIYVAYLIKKHSDSPIMIPLCEEKEIYNALKKEKVLSKLIWEPLEKEIEGIDKIYFAPTGELYNIPIESLPHRGGGLMSDKWNIYRLSSTRELSYAKDANSIKHASVYGGIRYETDMELLVADSRRIPFRSSYNSLPYELTDTLNMRSGVAYLPATKVEAEEIDNTLARMGISTTLKMDTLATEGDFKNLSGKRIDLLHIATHGFYWSEREARFRSDLSFLMLDNNATHRAVEDKALTRSGLLFAGANNALTGKKLPHGVDDGILTANEISQLDFRDMDLVVLSACQTGLGEIKGDGVFGLQRGFKKAGAKSIMMSLWKVDDEATRLLMTQFYKNLTSGMSKHESLKQAQKYLREYEVEVEMAQDSRHQISAHAKEQARHDANKEKTTKKVKKYQDPYYWAGFILLDALN